MHLFEFTMLRDEKKKGEMSEKTTRTVLEGSEGPFEKPALFAMHKEKEGAR